MVELLPLQDFNYDGVGISYRRSKCGGVYIEALNITFIVSKFKHILQSGIETKVQMTVVAAAWRWQLMTGWQLMTAHDS